MPKQAEAKRDGVMNPQNYNFNKFQIIAIQRNWCILSLPLQSEFQKYRPL